jgi:sugar lactone lactonase YvrE
VADNQEIFPLTPDGAYTFIGRVRRITPDGVISTFAGGGSDATGEDIRATEASINGASGVADDEAGNVYVTETERPRVRRISPDRTIRTFAGNGEFVFGPPPENVGDNGPATAATLVGPVDVAIDWDGGVLIVDLFGDRIRKVGADGIITTVVGGGRPGPPPQVMTATTVSLTRPSGVAVAPDGTIYVMTLFELLKVTPDQVVRSVSARSGTPRNNAGPVERAGFKPEYELNAMASDPDGNVFVADTGHYQLRRIGTDGIVHTFAGTGVFRQEGENWPAVVSYLNSPRRLAAGNRGQIYIIDRDNCKIREIQSNGLIRTVAGNGECVSFGGPNGPEDGVSATSIGFGGLFALAVDVNDNLLVLNGPQIRRIGPDGRISTVVNRRGAPFPLSGDGPAIDAAINTFPDSGLAIDRSGNLYISETGAHRIRKVTPDGTITTIAGTGPAMMGGPGGFGGDNGPATQASLNRPGDLVVDRSGNVFFIDAGNNRIRKITPDGIISTIAGPGIRGTSGDGGPATSASFALGFGVQLAVDSTGNLYVTDGHRIRRIGVDGIVTTIAGTGERGFSGDGGAPENARFADPYGIVVNSVGDLYVADTGNHRIRRISVR